MNDAVLPYLRCPNCSAPLSAGVGTPGPRSLRCAKGHTFDIARQGYATLTAGRYPHAGDSAEMVAARAAFLAAGHYAFIAGALAAAAKGTAGRGETAEPATAAGGTTAAGDMAGVPGLVLDAGTGTGYYLSEVLDALPDAIGLGLDVAKPALRRAARAHPRAGAVLTDLWRPLPLADRSAALILNVFAPRNGPEFHRVLRPGGTLLVVTPAADHLAELVGAYGLIRVDPDKAGRVGGSLGDRFVVASVRPLRHEMRLTAAEIRTLIAMTPSARHVPLDALRAQDRTVTAAVDLTTYRAG